MPPYTYESTWREAQKVTWQVDDLIGPDKPLDFDKAFLPETIARVDDIACLSPSEKRILNQIRGNSYLHLFVLVEQFIIPMVLDRVKSLGYHDIFATQALLGFAEEEGKHIHLFQSFAQAFEQGFGHPCDCIGPTADIAATILSHDPLSVLLLTLQFEWTTQSHYLESVRNNREDNLDARFCDLLKFHWLEEAQHTKLDALLVYELTAQMTADQIAAAITDYLRIVHLLHESLMAQVQLDLVSLERTLGHPLSVPERNEILQVQQQAYRWAFLCTGLTHPNFVRVLNDISPTGKTQVVELAKAWS